MLVCAKLWAAAMITTRLRDNRVFGDRTLVTGALLWCGAVLCLHALLAWLLPTLLFRTWVLALVAILAVPLARLSAAPLALEWNRHR